MQPIKICGELLFVGDAARGINAREQGMHAGLCQCMYGAGLGGAYGDGGHGYSK